MGSWESPKSEQDHHEKSVNVPLPWGRFTTTVRDFVRRESRCSYARRLLTRPSNMKPPSRLECFCSSSAPHSPQYLRDPRICVVKAVETRRLLIDPLACTPAFAMLSMVWHGVQMQDKLALIHRMVQAPWEQPGYVRRNWQLKLVQCSSWNPRTWYKSSE